MSTFEPDVILSVLKNLKAQASERKAFESRWNESVKSRVGGWRKKQTHTSSNAQLEWESHVVEYVNYLYGQVKVHGNATHKTQPKPLSKDIPLLGPLFLPPSYMHIQRRHSAPVFDPELAYLKPLNVIHPLFYPGLARCPRCKSDAILWEGWTTNGPREVHGVCQEERALGFQLRCKECEDSETGSAKGPKFCVATTNTIFWENWEHWEIPNGMPHFFKRCAVTRDLFNLIIELRPSLTSGGLSEHIKQIHLLEYHKRVHEYLEYFKSIPDGRLFPPQVKPFSEPTAKWGYNDNPICDDLITEVFLEFSGRTRNEESDEYLRTLTGRCISGDATFKIGAKSTLSDSKGHRVKVMKGGMSSYINEISEILSWRYSQTQANAEQREILEGIKRRCDALGVAYPELAVVDNCCHVGGDVRKVFPDIDVVLDVWHFSRRYLAVVLGGTHNPHQGAVAKDIIDAVLVSRASGNTPAVYHTQAEQEVRLQAAYEKWCEVPGVWSVAASKVHADQLRHVKKGCLSRKTNDLRSDGSRIEGTHRHWNNLQRSYSSGIVMMQALAHDFVLRRNIRIATAARDRPPTLFVQSTHGSHHTRLVTRIASIWNALSRKKNINTANLSPRPELPVVNSGENFGLVTSSDATSFGGLIEMKKEEPQDELLDLSTHDSDDVNQILHELDIDPALLLVPQQHANSAPAKLSQPIHDLPDSKSQSTVIDLTVDGTAKVCSVPATAPITDGLCLKRKLGGDDERVAAPKKRRMDVGPPPVSELVIVQAPLPLPQLAPELAVVTPTPPVAQPPNNLLSFFTRSRAASQATSPAPNLPTQSSVTNLSALARRLPAPSLQSLAGLTRSQSLFTVSTGLDARALSIDGSGGSEEFYLFMEMRAEQQWVSYGMNSRKWIIATNDFNSRLAALNKAKNIVSTIPKHPRALMEQLAVIEAKIGARIASNNFTSQKGNEIFWRRHCFVVSLVKPGNSSDLKSRKTAICSRCHMVMYPGGTENHKKGYCADGARQIKRRGDEDDAPDWPQPQGLFAMGTHFYPIEFLKMVREMYERVVVRGESGTDVPIEYEAFGRMLKSRTTIDEEGNILFKLYDLIMPPSTPDQLIIIRDGRKHLRLDCLRDN